MNFSKFLIKVLLLRCREFMHCIHTLRTFRTSSPRLKTNGGQAPLRFSFSPLLPIPIPILILIQLGCPAPPTEPPQNTTITLEEISTGITGTTLKVAVEDSTDEWTFTLTRNDSTVLTQTVYQRDTLIKDNGLTPTTTYNYKAYWMDGAIRKDSSNLLSIMTGDTTSHNFVWEIDTLGEYGSYLNDVAIVNENDIWVVGKIVTDTATYNAAHWDGNEWEMILISPAGLINPISCIYAISENDIWFGKMGLPVHWDGESYYKYTPANSTHPGQPTINAIWGTSSSNMYFVGNSGSIVHYDGSSFEQMASGTEVNLEDIDGTEDGEDVFVSGFNLFGYNNTSPLLHIHDGEVTKVYESTYPWGNESDWGRIEAIEVISDTVYLTTWGRDWIAYNYLTGEAREYLNNSIPVFFGTRMVDISSNGTNDILLAGAFPATLHFNGLSWFRDNQVFNLFGENNFIVEKSDMSNNVVVMVGHFYGNAGGIIARGYRIQ